MKHINHFDYYFDYEIVIVTIFIIILLPMRKKIVNIFKLNKNFEIKILIKIKNFFKFKIFYNRKK